MCKSMRVRVHALCDCNVSYMSSHCHCSMSARAHRDETLNRGRVYYSDTGFWLTGPLCVCVAGGGGGGAGAVKVEGYRVVEYDLISNFQLILRC